MQGSRSHSFQRTGAVVAAVLASCSLGDGTRAQTVGTVDCIVPGAGAPSTIDKGPGPEPIQVGTTIDIGDRVETNSDMVQYEDDYGGKTRMGPGAVMEMMPARAEIQAVLPGVTFSPWFLEGEVISMGNGAPKYRTSCYFVAAPDRMGVFLQPGSSESQDQYYSLRGPAEVWDDHEGAWTLLFELDEGEKAILDTIDGVHQLPASIQTITDEEYAYITRDYLDSSSWPCQEPCQPWPKIPAVSAWGLIVLGVLLMTVGTIVLDQRRRAAAV